LKKNDKSELDNAFELVTNKLTEGKIPWWLEGGSLLGCIREGKRIQWDDDYDIGYPLEYATKVLKTLIQINELDICSNLYFKVRDKKENIEICLKPHIQINDKIYEVAENKILRCINVGNYFLNAFLRSLPFYFQKLLVRINMGTYILKRYRGSTKDYSKFIIKDMGGVPSPVPIGYNHVLEIHYGSDYMTPRKKYDYVDRGGSVKERKKRKDIKELKEKGLYNIAEMEKWKEK
jgi:hypothetical protein